MSQYAARVAALETLTKAAALLRPDQRARLEIGFRCEINVHLESDDPAAAGEVAEIMHLTAEPPAATATAVHHVWSGTWLGHRVRVMVVVPVDRCSCGKPVQS